MKYYAGIGSRETPSEILSLMTKYAAALASDGYTLRSGGAEGADSAFELGSGIAKEIYLPWNRFNGKSGIVAGDIPELVAVAQGYHPAWPRLSQGAKKLHTRNVAQIVGLLPPHSPISYFVLCWTPGAKGGGGTGQAIRIARGYNVPIYDLADVSNTFERDWL